jgi:hypothetical protein
MNALSQWPSLAAAGMIAMQEQPKRGRPRIYTDEQRRQRARAAEARYRARRAYRKAA